MTTVKLTTRERPVLATLAELTRPNGEFCVPFSHVSGMPRNATETAEVRRVVRQLARKGLAEFHRGLFSEDGDLCGSGYCVSEAGQQALVEVPLDE